MVSILRDKPISTWFFFGYRDWFRKKYIIDFRSKKGRLPENFCKRWFCSFQGLLWEIFWVIYWMDMKLVSATTIYPPWRKPSKNDADTGKGKANYIELKLYRSMEPEPSSNCGKNPTYFWAPFKCIVAWDDFPVTCSRAHSNY